MALLLGSTLRIGGPVAYIRSVSTEYLINLSVVFLIIISLLNNFLA